MFVHESVWAVCERGDYFIDAFSKEKMLPYLEIPIDEYVVFDVQFS
jgi:hypothetical protein